jgi:hypothetical protein
LPFNPKSEIRNPKFLLLVLLAMAAPAYASSAADAYMYIPPWMADHVVFYHTFAQGPDKPEINLLGAKLAAPPGTAAPGLTGPGFRASDGQTKRMGLQLQGVALALHKPLTVSMWWRLDAPMKETTGYPLIGLHAAHGYISNFIAGKGPWCGLTRPAFVTQCYSFPGVSNVNGIWDGDGWAKENVWHHSAITVAGGSEISIYWDGVRRSRTNVNGRLFGPEDAVKTIHLGPDGAGHPMTLAEVLVLDGALTADEIRAYMTSVQALASMSFPAK